MFRHKRILVFVAVIILVPIAVVAWWLLSPLFVDKTVQEKFPLAANATVPSGMSRSGVENIMAGMAKLNQQVSEDMPEAVPRETQASTVELKAGEFRGADRFHKGSGRAGIYRLADGAHLLRLEDFNVTNGPDLRVILSPSENPMNSGDATAPGHVELAKLKGNLGNQN